MHQQRRLYMLFIMQRRRLRAECKNTVNRASDGQTCGQRPALLANINRFVLDRELFFSRNAHCLQLYQS